MALSTTQTRAAANGPRERRRARRYPGGFLATEICGDGGRFFLTIHDYSHTGLSWYDSLGRARVGARVRLVTTPPGSPTVRLDCEVVRVQDGRVGARILHVRRRDVDPLDSFLRGG